MRSLAHFINKALEILCISILALMSILVFLNVVFYAMDLIVVLV